MIAPSPLLKNGSRGLGPRGEDFPMDRIEQGFAVTAITSFFVLIGAVTWLMVVG
jgi:hypothetical protein